MTFREPLKNKTFIYEIIFWTSLLLTALWWALKIAGYINTPLWLQLLPVGTVIFGAGAFFEMVKNMGSGLRTVGTKISHMDRDIGYLRVDVEVLKSDMKSVKGRLHA